MKTFKEILLERDKYKTKKQIFDDKKEIENLLYRQISNVKKHVDILDTDVKSDMFKIDIDRRINRGIDKGTRKGRKSHNMIDVLIIKWYDSFYKKDRSIDFYSVKEFNNFLDKIK